MPPDLRPLVPLDGGRFATSDLNDLYRRVINRNNRLKRLMELNAPDIIIRNEKRMLQEAVDVLFDNGRRGKVITGPNKRPLKSLSDMLKGKQGRFRQNLLGKRVDYSGRSVIVIGPDLRLHQCGLPKKMALELFKPFIYHQLERKGIVTTIKSAKKMVERETEEVWDTLSEVVREYPILLNRAPTLHRLSIQAFEPILIEGKAIQLHPLVCAAFNADFDGDQMAVHVPLSIQAQIEARVLMMSTNNILSPANGEPIIVPSQDIVLGLYYMTREKPFVKGEGKCFSSTDELIMAYDAGEVDLQALVTVRMDGKRIETTAGRVILFGITPQELGFEAVNKVINKKEVKTLISLSYRLAGIKKTVIFADKLKDMGYKFATKSGLSISINDMEIPAEKVEILNRAMGEVKEVDQQYREGLITDGEKYNKIVDIWARATEEVTERMMDRIAVQEFKALDDPAGDGDQDKRESVIGASFNPIYMMADSGSRGSKDQIRQLAGMRGLMAKPSGEIIETPIMANFREGLTVLQYFTSTHGARKGLADTALKTAGSGYLTRRLVDVAQDCIVMEEDCGTLDGVWIEHLREGGEIIQRLGERVLGRVALMDVRDPVGGEVLIEANQEIDEKGVRRIEEAGLDKILIRSALTCKTKQGVCAKCYGRDLAHGKAVDIGEAVGIIAAQSIGEPGTQLTMRTFHIGGTASRRVEQSNIQARREAVVKYENLVTVVNKAGEVVVLNRNGALSLMVGESTRERYQINLGTILMVKDGEKVQRDQLIAEWDPYTVPLLTDVSGKIAFTDIVDGRTMQEKLDPVTGLSTKVIVESRDSDVRPQVMVVNEKNQPVTRPNGSAASFAMPVGAILMVTEGSEIWAGDVLARIPRETTKTKDITGGLPRVVELFEVRKPKEHTVISQIDGTVSFGKPTKGKRKVIVTPEVGEAKEYLIPKSKHLIVQEGEYIRSGEPLMDGSANPHDILAIMGAKELARYLLNEVQEVYRLQGVKINDKHIEIIVRQMLRKVQIKDVGDTNFLMGEQAERYRFEEENERVLSRGGTPATAEPMLLGITKASLSTESFISAASFQETTKVLTEAAIAGKVDNLRGLKENVIMGRLIPGGTGFREYRQLRIAQAAEPDEGPEALSEELT